jgi:hypothetical protein
VLRQCYVMASLSSHLMLRSIRYAGIAYCTKFKKCNFMSALKHNVCTKSHKNPSICYRVTIWLKLQFLRDYDLFVRERS